MKSQNSEEKLVAIPCQFLGSEVEGGLTIRPRLIVSEAILRLNLSPLPLSDALRNLGSFCFRIR
jgi:hypothetical protein